MGEFHLKLFVFLVMLLSLVEAEGNRPFPENCSKVCDCKWQSGNKVADCTKKKPIVVPTFDRDDVQLIDLTDSPLKEITDSVFYLAGLQNIKKMILKNCEIETVHEAGFKHLTIMIELDLSKNHIKTLKTNTFNGLDKLRILILNENKLERLEKGLFQNLYFLQKIEMKENRIFSISAKTFHNLPSLKFLILSENNLKYLELETISSFKNLSSLELYNNPWVCDCRLRSFRDYLVQNNLYTKPTACAEPPKLLNKKWNELNSTDFACKPKIMELFLNSVEKSVGENITLSCKVTGNPTPHVYWAQNTVVFHNEMKSYGENRHIIIDSGPEVTKWVNLTIKNVKYNDRGEFTCIAKNPAGKEEKSISLVVNRVPGAIAGSASSSDYWIYGLYAAFGAVILILIIMATCWMYKRNSIKRHSKSDMNSSNGEALIEGSVIPEMEKSLITTVNPVTKPPRRYDAPASVISGGTEMSELNKTLLDNESVYVPNEDESRSVEYVHHPKSARDTLSVTTSGHEPRTYPPDLLSFPPRGGQTSPAASSASTAPDSSRLPPQLQQSPLHSPIYGTNPNHYKTLSHSRSQSPFTSPCAPVAQPRIGYVTIPRRPRVPSWGSTSNYITVAATTEFVEPVYDNLGLRTTVDGSSVLSLNKTGLEQQLSPVMRGRPLPSTPGSYQSAIVYTPIEEHDQAPSPAPSTPYSTTLPRLGNNSQHYQISPTDSEKKNSRLKMNKDQIYDTPKLIQKESLSNGQIYDTPSANDALARTGKIPPRPPPKPRKKNSADPNGPLFEDEGEDGTEV